MCEATGELEIETWRSKLLDRSRECCPAHQPMIFCGFPGLSSPWYYIPQATSKYKQIKYWTRLSIWGYWIYAIMSIRGKGLCHIMPWILRWRGHFWSAWCKIAVATAQPSWPVLAAKQLVFLTAKLPDIRRGEWAECEERHRSWNGYQVSFHFFRK